MSTTTLDARLQSLIDKEIRKDVIHSIVLGVQSKDGKINFSGAAGFADAESRVPMTPESPYFIASITKMYTTAAIMKLVEQGRIDLDAPITAYLPDSVVEGIHIYQGKDYSRQIKVYQLLAQTSGLADYFEDKPKGGRSVVDDLKAGRDMAYDSQWILETVRKLKPHFAPGTNQDGKAHYSDTNFHLLGVILQAVTGQTVAEVFQKWLCEPLGLRQTYAYDYENLRPGAQPALIYNKTQPLHIPRAMSSFGQDGGIVSTVAESLAFTRAFFDGELFDRCFLDRMMSRWNLVFFPLVQYGYGMMRFQMPSWMMPFQYRPELIGHAGSSNSFAFYNPDRGIYIAGTLNQVDAPSRGFTFMIKVLSALKG